MATPTKLYKRITCKQKITYELASYEKHIYEILNDNKTYRIQKNYLLVPRYVCHTKSKEIPRPIKTEKVAATKKNHLGASGMFNKFL